MRSNSALLGLAVAFVAITLLTSATQAVTISGPATVPVCYGQLIKINATPSQPSSRLVHFLFPAYGDVDYMLVGDTYVLAAPHEPAQVNIAVVEFGKDGEIITAQHTLTITDDANPPPPPPPPPPPQFDAESIHQAAAKALANIKPPHNQAAPAVAAVARTVSQNITDDFYQNLDTADRDLTRRNREVLAVGPQRSAWFPLFRAIQAANEKAGMQTLDHMRQSLDALARALVPQPALRLRQPADCPPGQVCPPTYINAP